jgi:electron transport complex protein RnfC
MLRRRYGSFAGGIDLPDEKAATLDAPIVPAGPLAQLRVPLAPCGGPAARLLVAPGREVCAGERLAAGTGPDAPPAAHVPDVFAPLSGRVAALTTARVAVGDTWVRVPAVEITHLARPAGAAAVEETFDWRAASDATLRLRLAEGGLLTHDGRPEPLVRWLRRVRQRPCRLLVVNGVEHQPRVTADHRLLAERGAEVIRGLEILARCVGAATRVLAVDRRRTDSYRQLVGPSRLYRIERIALEPKYPAGAPNVLTKILARREVPAGGDPSDVGVAMVTPATCFAVHRWVACGLPPTGRVVTIAGERAAAPANRWVPFGAALADVAGPAEPPLIHGGPMNGLAAEPEAVVGPATDAVLALDAERPGPAAPCIRCGWCTDHCPVRLNVARLNDLFELGQLERAGRLGVEACVGCGVCSYVCPARLPLRARMRRLREALAETRRSMPLFAVAEARP